jgi:hypothetical protein
MSHCRTKKRVCCRTNSNCFVNNFALFKKNIGITQPKSAPRRRTSRYYNGEKTQLAKYSIGGDPQPAYHTTLDNMFASDGFGQPSSANRKQRTFNINKYEKNYISGSFNLQATSDAKEDIVNKQNYKNGFMYKSQAYVESNVGSMDRLLRLKARNIRKYVNNEYKPTSIQTFNTHNSIAIQGESITVRSETTNYVKYKKIVIASPSNTNQLKLKLSDSTNKTDLLYQFSEINYKIMDLFDITLGVNYSDGSTTNDIVANNFADQNYELEIGGNKYKILTIGNAGTNKMLDNGDNLCIEIDNTGGVSIAGDTSISYPKRSAGDILEFTGTPPTTDANGNINIDFSKFKDFDFDAYGSGKIFTILTNGKGKKQSSKAGSSTKISYTNKLTSVIYKKDIISTAATKDSLSLNPIKTTMAATILDKLDTKNTEDDAEIEKLDKEAFKRMKSKFCNKQASNLSYDDYMTMEKASTFDDTTLNTNKKTAIKAVMEKIATTQMQTVSSTKKLKEQKGETTNVFGEKEEIFSTPFNMMKPKFSSITSEFSTDALQLIYNETATGYAPTEAGTNYHTFIISINGETVGKGEYYLFFNITKDGLNNFYISYYDSFDSDNKISVEILDANRTTGKIQITIDKTILPNIRGSAFDGTTNNWTIEIQKEPYFDPSTDLKGLITDTYTFDWDNQENYDNYMTDTVGGTTAAEKWAFSDEYFTDLQSNFANVYDKFDQMAYDNFDNFDDAEFNIAGNFYESAFQEYSYIKQTKTKFTIEFSEPIKTTLTKEDFLLAIENVETIKIGTADADQQGVFATGTDKHVAHTGAVTNPATGSDYVKLYHDNNPGILNFYKPISVKKEGTKYELTIEINPTTGATLDEQNINITVIANSNKFINSNGDSLFSPYDFVPIVQFSKLQEDFLTPVGVETFNKHNHVWDHNGNVSDHDNWFTDAQTGSLDNITAVTATNIVGLFEAAATAAASAATAATAAATAAADAAADAAAAATAQSLADSTAQAVATLQDMINVGTADGATAEQQTQAANAQETLATVQTEAAAAAAAALIASQELATANAAAAAANAAAAAANATATSSEDNANFAQQHGHHDSFFQN